MSFYGRHIFPRIMEAAMAGFDDVRRDLLARARGDVLEIGIGHAHNLPQYPAGVRQLWAVTPDAELPPQGQKRLAAAPFPVNVVTGTAAALPFAPDQFDAVVATLVFCSIPDALAAAREVRRVLKPGGRFLYLEHVRSPNDRIATWQHRLDPLWTKLAGGCHLDRDTARTFTEAGLALTGCERLQLPGLPIVRDFIRGSAAKAH